MSDRPAIEGYTDLQRIARGGFGTVYRAHQDRFGRVVALKVLDVEALDDDARRRFERECLAMGSLSWHPNVVALHDSGITDDDHPYLVMEFLDAGSLGDRLAHGPLAWPHAVRAGVEVAGALGAAHAAGTLHRDLKPENLLVGPFGEAKLGDFGIAAVEGSARSSSGIALTIAHVAPEVLRGDEPDERADVYSLASTLHTLIAGEPPIDTHGDLAAVLARILHTPPARLTDVPRALADVVHRSLAKEPADRPAGAAELGRALQAVQVSSGHPVTALRLRPGQDERPPAAPVPPPARTIRVPPAAPATGPAPAVAAAPTVAPPAPASGAPRPGVPPAAAPAPSSSNTMLVGALVAVFALIALGGLAALLLARDDGGGGGTTTTVSASVAEPTVVTTVDVGASPQFLDLTDDAAWVASSGTGAVARIDVATNEVVATVPTGTGAFGVAATGDAVWVSNSGEGTLSHVDPASNEVTATIPLQSLPSDLTATEDDVWVTGANNGTLTHVDARTDTVEQVIAVGTNPNDVALGAGALWVVDPTENAVFRIDPDADRVEEQIDLRTGSRPNSVVATDDAVWVTGFGNASLFRIDPATNEVVATVEVGNGPTGVDATTTAVWVANQNDGTLSRVDPATNSVVATAPVGDGPSGVAASETEVWVTNFGAATATRVDPAG